MAGCRGESGSAHVPEDATRSARGAALALFRCAGGGKPTTAEVSVLFGTDLAAQDRARLDLALESLRGLRDMRISGEGPAGHDKTAVDLEASLPAGGAARYAVQALRLPEGAWRIVSFQGPGVSWPPSPSPRDEGLTTSAPPAGGSSGDR